MVSQSLLLLALPILAAAQKCPIQFDGRVPRNFSLTTFDSPNSLYSSKNVFGKNLMLSKLLQLPSVDGSLFDTDTVPVEVTISDKSIFAPSADNVQTGFRRAELQPASNNGTDKSTIGIKTLHFSLMPDKQRHLNLTHEYQLVFLESADFSTNQFVLKTGTMIGTKNSTSDPSFLQLFGNVNADPPQVLFSTPFFDDVFSNFALSFDFNNHTTQVFYSKGASPLEAVTDVLSNDVSGQGQFHFGLLKKPIDGGDDVAHNGIQESGINEGVIYGGIFEEDSSYECISLAP